jgi:hypothetical protein
MGESSSKISMARDAVGRTFHEQKTREVIGISPRTHRVPQSGYPAVQSGVPSLSGDRKCDEQEIHSIDTLLEQKHLYNADIITCGIC